MSRPSWDSMPLSVRSVPGETRPRVLLYISFFTLLDEIFEPGSLLPPLRQSARITLEVFYPYPPFPPDRSPSQALGISATQEPPREIWRVITCFPFETDPFRGVTTCDYLYFPQVESGVIAPVLSRAGSVCCRPPGRGGGAQCPVHGDLSKRFSESYFR